MLVNRSPPSLGLRFARPIALVEVLETPGLTTSQIPIDLTQSPSTRKRQETETEPNSDDEILTMFDKDTGPGSGGNQDVWASSLHPSEESVKASARIVGIGKSLVLSIDMPLLIPYPDSTAMASYVTSISGMLIFSNTNDARVLARDTANFMKSQDWEDSAGLAIQYERVLAPPEGFLPVRVVADKLTDLGQPLKPAVIFEGRKWPQVIAADALRQLGWDAFDQIGQTPDNDEHAA
ncbi:uncharacterized protein FSUBG_1868 [Fusarium subglutinans]|uniref:Uncharacterized protein n=1 Tax=Gibberella subglutinans TaxID=42677 RepID=A0A8H5QDC5_GIBSU|nr:uncharacterized protein FSUBG_1868 [Fusarium subglutinans]KAF5611841.1 hypothetical protein FSUBG_1868 [Fusarium subglutinans]